MQDLTITFVQTSLVWEDIQANLDHFESLLLPFQGKQDLVCLPEMFTTGFSAVPEKLAELPGSRTMLWMHELAKKLGSVICGTAIMREGGYYYNRLVWMRPDGSYETMDKRHLFTMGDEHLRFTAGKKRLVVELNGWKIRPLICYDLRFPVWAKNTWKADVYEYDLLIFLANWPEARRQVWKSLLNARAIENLAYCLGVNRTGADGNGLTYSGDSCLVNYRGDVLLDAASAESCFTVTLTAESLHEFRSKFNVGPDWDDFQIRLQNS